MTHRDQNSVFAPHDRTWGWGLRTKPGAFSDGRTLLMERDASGKKEAFYGLQVANTSTTLSHRDQVVATKDRNGFGWSSPFVVSSAGYGVFFHNEYTEDALFRLQNPIAIESKGNKGEMDFFLFFGPQYADILRSFTALTGRPPMPPRKLLGFQYLVQGVQIDHTEAFHQWRQHGYAVDSCITFTDVTITPPRDIAQVKAVADELHQADALLGFYFDVLMPGTFSKLNPRPEPHTYPYKDWSAFKKVFKESVVDQGADWFWVDETDEPNPLFGNFDAGYPFHLYQAMFETYEASGNGRGFLCGRGGYPGCQRFGYPWMGDKEYNRTTMLANLTQGMIGVAHSTQDMAGATPTHEGEFADGVRTGFLNPLAMCNNWVLGLSSGNQRRSVNHRPWENSLSMQRVYQRYHDLHYRLVPYFYQLAWESHTSGLPAWRSLVFEDLANTAYGDRDEVLVGPSLLYAPLYKHNSRSVLLPPGAWMHYFSGRQLAGGTTIPFIQGDPCDAALYVRMGSIIPMMESVASHLNENPTGPLVLDLYPTEKHTSLKVYQDDGRTRDYQQGAFCTTEVQMGRTNGDFCLRLGGRTGQFRPQQRSVVCKVLWPTQPEQVALIAKPDPALGSDALRSPTASDERLPFLASETEFKAAEKGWTYAFDDLTKTYRLWIKIPDTADKTVAIRTISAKTQVLPTPTGSATAVQWLTTEKVNQLNLRKGQAPLESLVCQDPAVTLTKGASLREWSIRVTDKTLLLTLAAYKSPGSHASVSFCDAGTGRVLDTMPLPAESNPWAIQYQVRGSVLLRLNGMTEAAAATMRMIFETQPLPTAEQITQRNEVFLLERDTTSKGNWKEHYGKAGFAIAGLAPNIPADIGYENKMSTCVWRDQVADSEGLMRPDGDQRIAAGYYGAGKDCSITLTNKSGRPRRVAFYIWPNGTTDRSMVIRALDPVDGKVLHQYNVYNPEKGVYFEYSFEGNVTFQALATKGPNAVINAVFFND
ncbi:MAG: TIM-barrel domain-containing protein [Verrucomicrobiota bacterium]